LKPVRHDIPEPSTTPAPVGPDIIERDYGNKDYGK